MKIYKGDELLQDDELDATDADLAAEIAAREAADDALQADIDAIVVSSGVTSVAGEVGVVTAAALKTALSLPSNTVTGKQDVDADLTAIAGLSPSNDHILQRKSGAWTNRTMAQLKTDLAITFGDITGAAPLASPALTGTPTVPTATAGNNTTQISSTAFVQTAVGAATTPAGAMVMYAPTGAAPAGWFVCDGTAISRTTYATLFTAIGTTYGVGDGSTTFNLPNMAGKFPVGYDSTQTEFDAIAETGGAKTVTVIEANLPPHAHTINHTHSAATTSSSGSHSHQLYVGAKTMDTGSGTRVVNNVGGYSASSGTEVAGYGNTVGSPSHNHTVSVPAYAGSSGNGAGTSTAVNKLPPYIVVRWLIKY